MWYNKHLNASKQSTSGKHLKNEDLRLSVSLTNNESSSFIRACNSCSD